MVKRIPRYTQRAVRNTLTYLLLLIAFLGFIIGLYKGGIHVTHLKTEEITIGELPSAMLLSWLRMAASFAASVVFAFILGLTAACFPLGERLIIPLLDILQSVPVTGFFPAAVGFFVALGHGQRIGIECAAIFLIFTSQAWNLAFAVYEATKTIPDDQRDAVQCFGLSGSARFWKLYAPACIPRLVYNSILSWSNGWFFLVACEIISVGPIQFNLPGIGSFLQRASEENHPHLIFWGLGALTATILAMDFLVWRPASFWAERFRYDTGTGSAQAHFSYNEYLRASPIHFKMKSVRRWMTILSFPVVSLFKNIVLPIFWDIPAKMIVGLIGKIYFLVAEPTMRRWNALVGKFKWLQLAVFWLMGTVIGYFAARFLIHWFSEPLPEISKSIPLAILFSTGRLVISLGFSIVVVFFIIQWVWDKPAKMRILNTVSQVGASIPAAALFPLIMTIIVHKFHGGMELASVILLVSGMIWYVLFNGLGGVAVIPPDLVEAVRGLGLSRYGMFKKLVIPAMQPALITGAITAWGGGWNALVVSEYVVFQEKRMTVNGLGALLNKSVIELGDSRSITICIFSMVLWVIFINTILWRPLYQNASEKYRFDS